MKGQITLEGMQFICCHGCLEQERRTPNLFIVDFEGSLELGAAALSDSLDDTVDYTRIYDIVAQRMQTPCSLLEHLCALIVADISMQIPEFERFIVQVSKREPPVGGRVQWARVKIEHVR